MKLRVAQIRCYPRKGDLIGNHRRLLSVLGELVGKNPDVVVTPEGFLDGYIVTEQFIDRGNIKEYAIDPDTSDYARSISDWAAKNNCWFVFGCARTTERGVYNSALIFDRTGKRIGIYDKTHLQNHDLKYQPGMSLPVFPSDFGTFGVMICADRRWPETVRTLVLGGARIIFNPTFGMHNDTNLRMMQTRSYESEVFIAFTHPAQSLITGPGGEIVSDDRSTETSWSITEIDLSEVEKSRSKEYSHLGNRRPDIYEL